MALTDSPTPERRPLRKGWFVSALTLVLVGGITLGVLAYTGILPLRKPPGEISLAQLPEDPLPDIDQPLKNPGFLGPQSCAPCHAKRVEEFLKTNHAHAMRTVEPDLMPKGFEEGKNRLIPPNTHIPPGSTAEGGNLEVIMTREGNSFFQKTRAADSRGMLKEDSRRIDFVYGWGHLDEVNFSWDKDRLWELPVAWIYPSETWGVASTFMPQGTAPAIRDATPNCLECHTTWFAHYPGTTNRYQPDSFILGVTCERCHGMGKDHVTYHQAHPGEKKAQKIVHPGELTRERQIEICTQCHSNAIREKGPVFSYRPGEPLDTAYHTIHPKYPEDDHVANQATYLRKSKCFEKDETLSCTTCHDPHRPHEPVPPREQSRSCASCHESADCKEQPKLPAGVRDQCTSCHMPPRVWMNVNFHMSGDLFVPPIRRVEHNIGIYPEATGEVLLRYLEKQSPPNKTEIQKQKTFLVDFWTREARKRKADFRYLAAIGAVREALRVEPADPNLKKLLSELIQDQSSVIQDLALADKKRNDKDLQGAKSILETVIQLKPNYAMAHGKLGSVLAMLGKKEQARTELLTVGQLDPDESYGVALLGWLAYLDGKPQEAIDFFRKSDQVQPYNSKTQYQMGLAYLQLERWEEASSCFQRATEIDPHHSGARQGLSHALRKIGQTKEALIQARLAAKMTSETNADILLTLVDAYLAEGDSTRAQAMAQRGLRLAEDQNSNELQAQFRNRLSKFNR